MKTAPCGAHLLLAAVLVDSQPYLWILLPAAPCFFMHKSALIKAQLEALVKFERMGILGRTNLMCSSY